MYTDAISHLRHLRHLRQAETCHVFSNAIHRFNTGDIADQSHHSDIIMWMSIGVPPLLTFVLISGLAYRRTVQFWRLRNRSWRRRYGMHVTGYLVFVTLFITVPVIFWRRQAKEKLYMDLISGRYQCKTDTFLETCSAACKAVGAVKLEIWKLRVVQFGNIFYRVYYSLLVTRNWRRNAEEHDYREGPAAMSFLLTNVEEGDTERENAGEEVCPICLDELWMRQACTTECGHLFHRACVDHWLHTAPSPSCPLCKALVSQAE